LRGKLNGLPMQRTADLHNQLLLSGRTGWQNVTQRDCSASSIVSTRCDL